MVGVRVRWSKAEVKKTRARGRIGSEDFGFLASG